MDSYLDVLHDFEVKKRYTSGTTAVNLKLPPFVFESLTNVNMTHTIREYGVSAKDVRKPLTFFNKMGIFVGFARIITDYVSTFMYCIGVAYSYNYFSIYYFYCV